MLANILIFSWLVASEAGVPHPGSAAATTSSARPPATPTALATSRVVTPADEDPSSAAARTAAQSALADGNRRLKEGDVAGAIENYRRAQIFYPPAAGKIEFNIAKAEETRGDEPAAAEAFERFLSQALEIPAEYRDEARNELRRLSAALGALKLAEQRPGYEVLVDGREHGKTPLQGDLWVRPGHHVITLEQDDHVLFRDDVDVDGGGTVHVTVTIRYTGIAKNGASPALPAGALMTPPPRAPMPPPPLAVSAPFAPRESPARDDVSSPLWKRWWFWTAAGALVVGGAAILILSTGDKCPSGVMCRSVLDSTRPVATLREAGSR
jgi:PEGA domain